jgi:hypothetical protein
MQPPVFQFDADETMDVPEGLRARQRIALIAAL